MAIRTDVGYENARIISEPEVVQIIQHHGALRFLKSDGSVSHLDVIRAYQGSTDDDYDHTDVIVECKCGIVIHIDVKDQLGDNRGGNRYSVTYAEAEDVSKNPEKYENHMLALRQYKPSWQGDAIIMKPTGIYFMVPTKKALEKSSKWFFCNPSKDSWLLDPHILFKETGLCYGLR